MKLIAIDLDGTLLNDETKISSENTEAVRKVQNAGHTVAICSGRSLHDTNHILETAGLTCPVITGNGAIAWHNGEEVSALTLSGGKTEAVIKLLEQENYYYELYTNKGVHIFNDGKAQLEAEIDEMTACDSAFPAEEARRDKDTQFGQHGLTYIDDYHELDLDAAGIYKIFVMCFDRDKLDRLERRFEGDEELSLTSSGRAKLEIAHPDVSKGNALRTLAGHLGIPMESTVAIGDNLNDLSMFKAAGMSIAMGNGLEEVKRAATYTTQPYNEDGVAQALEQYVLKPEKKI